MGRMEISGLPAHPLVVHAAVVLLPMGAVLAILYAVVPRWRWLTRWPSLGLTVAGVASVGAAVLTGWDFKDDLTARIGSAPAGVPMHEERGQILFWMALVFALVLLLAVLALGGPSPLSSGRGGIGRHDALIEWSLVSGVVVIGIAVVLMTIATGESGARAVWGG